MTASVICAVAGWGWKAAYGTLIRRPGRIARPGHRTIVFVGVLGLWFGGGEARKLTSCRVQLGARAPTMACCQHGESPCGGYTLTPKSNNLSRLRGGVGSKLR